MSDEFMLPFERMPYEQDIIDDYRTFTREAGGGQSKPRKGVWILGHLRIIGENYTQNMYARWLDFVHWAKTNQNVIIKPGTLRTFHTYMWLLRRPIPPLILPGRQEPGTRGGIARQYYRLNPETELSPLWNNPYQQYASWRAQKRKGFPRAKKSLF